MLGILSNCQTGNASTYNGCVFEQAEKVGKELCEYVEVSLKDECYMNAAIGKDDESVCDFIVDSSVQANCLGSIAMYNERLKVVSRIRDQEKKYEWYTTIALRSNDWEICRKITEDPLAHGSCIYEMAKRINDPNLCFFVDKNTLHRDACYYHMGKHFMNSTYCIGVEGQILKAKCEEESVIPLKVTGRMVFMIQKLLTQEQ
jgi:hypothetical protein